jgi:site-specific DNA-methyltransferase (adenine-specific)
MGNVVQIGDAMLYLGDCREILPTLGTFDCVLTDPPYSSGARRDAERQVRGAMLRSLEDEDWFSHDTMTAWGFQWFLRGVLADLRPHLERGAHLYLFSDWRQTPNVYGMLESTGYRVNHCLVWAKTHYGMGGTWRNQHENIIFASLDMPREMADKGLGSVLTFAAVSPLARVHPTEKPLALLTHIMRGISNTSICDPFMGSGVTGAACLYLGRRFVGIEIDRQHFAVACQRIEAAHKQGRLFAPHAVAPIQESLLLEVP